MTRKKAEYFDNELEKEIVETLILNLRSFFETTETNLLIAEEWLTSQFYRKGRVADNFSPKAVSEIRRWEKDDLPWLRNEIAEMEILLDSYQENFCLVPKIIQSLTKKIVRRLDKIDRHIKARPGFLFFSRLFFEINFRRVILARVLFWRWLTRATIRCRHRSA